MNLIHHTTASGLVLALVLGGSAAFAEDATQAQDSDNASSNTLTVAAERLDGAAVVDRNGNNIGEVDELVRGEDGNSYAVISVGGFFDIGDKDIAMPLDRLSLQGDTVVLPKQVSSVDQLKGHEEFNEDLYTEIEDNDRVKIERFVMATGKSGSDVTMAVDAEEIDDAEVLDRSGNEIGDVDKVVRGEDGKTYAVISVGGFFDVGDKDIAMPLDRLSMWGESVVLPDDLSSIDQLRDQEEYNEDLYTEVEDEDQVQIKRSAFAAMELDDDDGEGDAAD